jgi:hypothetical protein
LIGGLALRWIVTVLFGVSIATHAYISAAQHVRWSNSVTHLLHLAMSAAMILMVWQVGLDLPAMGPTLFFLLAGVWFACLAVRVWPQSRERLKTCYYAAMMAAMAWMYALMGAGLAGHTTHSHHHASASADIGASSMRMPAHEMSPLAPELSWITAANWIAALGFAAVALYWSCRFFGERRMNRDAARLARMEPLHQAFTAAGTALMFGALIP